MQTLSIPKALFFLTLALSLSFAAVEWSLAVTGGINGKIVVSQGNAIFATFDGNIYALNPGTGAIKWMQKMGESISLEPREVDALTVAVAGSKGKLLLLDSKSGEIIVRQELNRTPRGLEGGDSRAYLVLNDTITAIDTKGKEVWKIKSALETGQVGYGGKAVYFVSQGMLHALDAATGTEKWVSECENTFLGRPARYFDTIYVGSIDGKLYAFDYAIGRKKWEYETGGWIMSTPAATEKAVYFGSNDGYLYSLSPSGKLRFRFKVGEGIWAEPEAYETASGGKYIVFSSNARKVTAVDENTGQEKWSFSTDGIPTSPRNYGKGFLFGTDSGKAYFLMTSPICSFTYPKTNDVVGDWEIAVEGKAHADTGISYIETRVENGNWERAEGKESWQTDIDFANYAPGPVTVECRAYDNEGNTEKNEFSFITLVRAAGLPMRKMYVNSPRTAQANETFLLTVNDEDGKSVRNIKIKIGEKEAETGNSPFSIVLGKGGETEISLEKSGYEPVTLLVQGEGSNDSIMMIIGGIVGIAIIALIAKAFLFKKKKNARA